MGKCVSIVVTNSIPGLVVEDGQVVIKRDCFTNEQQGDYLILTYKAKTMNGMLSNDLSAFPKHVYIIYQRLLDLLNLQNYTHIHTVICLLVIITEQQKLLKMSCGKI